MSLWHYEISISVAWEFRPTVHHINSERQGHSLITTHHYTASRHQKLCNLIRAFEHEKITNPKLDSPTLLLFILRDLKYFVAFPRRLFPTFVFSFCFIYRVIASSSSLLPPTPLINIFLPSQIKPRAKLLVPVIRRDSRSPSTLNQ